MQDYVPDFARKSGRAVRKNKGYVIAIPVAAGLGWLAAVGIDALSDNSVVNYVGSLIPQTFAAYTGGKAAVKIAESYKGRKLNAGEKTGVFILGALATAGIYKGVENLNSIPAVNEFLGDLPGGLEEDFPSKHRPEDIGIATGISLGANYAWEGIKGARNAFRRNDN